MALPVLSEASSPSYSVTTSSVPAASIDGLIARSKQLRQDNNSSLLRDDLLEAGPQPDWSFDTSTRPVRLFRVRSHCIFFISSICLQEASKLHEEAPANPERLQVTVDSDSLVSFLRHEQELCRDSLSCRGSSESGSLRSASAARRKAEAKGEPSGGPKAMSSSLEEMQRTLASWKAERLQRNVSGKALTRCPVSRSPPSSSASSDSAGPSTGGRTLRLWRQLEEVKGRSKAEEVQREREQNRAKGRAFSERMRAELLAKGKRAGKPKPTDRV